MFPQLCSHFWQHWIGFHRIYTPQYFVTLCTCKLWKPIELNQQHDSFKFLVHWTIGYHLSNTIHNEVMHPIIIFFEMLFKWKSQGHYLDLSEFIFNAHWFFMDILERPCGKNAKLLYKSVMTTQISIYMNSMKSCFM